MSHHLETSAITTSRRRDSDVCHGPSCDVTLRHFLYRHWSGTSAGSFQWPSSHSLARRSPVPREGIEDNGSVPGSPIALPWDPPQSGLYKETVRNYQADLVEDYGDTGLCALFLAVLIWARGAPENAGISIRSRPRLPVLARSAPESPRAGGRPKTKPTASQIENTSLKQQLQHTLVNGDKLCGRVKSDVQIPAYRAWSVPTRQVP